MQVHLQPEPPAPFISSPHLMLQRTASAARLTRACATLRCVAQQYPVEAPELRWTAATAFAAGISAAIQPYPASAAQPSASGPGPPGSGNGSGGGGGGGGGAGSDASSGGWGPFGWGRKKDRKPMEQPVVLTLVSFAVTRKAYSRVCHLTTNLLGLRDALRPLLYDAVCSACWHDMCQPLLLADHGKVRARVPGSNRQVSGLQAVFRWQRHPGACLSRGPTACCLTYDRPQLSARAAVREAVLPP